jgi:ABC-type transporter Mla MlaB component
MKSGKGKQGRKGKAAPRARQAAARKVAVKRTAKSAKAPAARHRKAASQVAAAAVGVEPVAAVAGVPDMTPVPADAVPPAEAAATPAAASTPDATPAGNDASPRGRGRAGLKLEASCTLRDSIDMQFQLLAVDFGDSDVLVDGSAVERIDTAGLQMLLAFARYHEGRGKTVRWSDVSGELLRSSEVLGVAGALGLKNAAGDTGGH